ncbi:MAG: SDR family oxidoreductase [Methanoregula sp.]|jgi:dTDP-4-dehydrorhamnose reductase|nr:SDR family oxidoreductase [Methanoregula sp.]
MQVKKLLITGSNGFLGSNLVHFFSQRADYEVFSTSQRKSILDDVKNFYQGDLQDLEFVKDLFSVIKPDLVINTVSLVNVDLCEERPSLAYDITVCTAQNVAQTAHEMGSRLIYISTDHLFDGKKSMYTEDDIPAPVNEYGRTKLLAEQKTIQANPTSAIIRTNFFGWSPHGHAPTFGEWVYNNLKDNRSINLFTDYYFTPIEVTYLSEAINSVIRSDFSGIINIAGSERCSKYEFGIALAKESGFDPSWIHPSKIAPDSFKAPRQQDLSLSIEKFRKTFKLELPDLHQSIERTIQKEPFRLS